MRSFGKLHVFACIYAASANDVNCSEYRTWDAAIVANLELPLRVLHNERAYKSDTYITDEPGAPDSLWTFEGDCLGGGGEAAVAAAGVQDDSAAVDSLASDAGEINEDNIAEITDEAEIQEAANAEGQELMSNDEVADELAAIEEEPPAEDQVAADEVAAEAISAGEETAEVLAAVEAPAVEEELMLPAEEEPAVQALAADETIADEEIDDDIEAEAYSDEPEPVQVLAAADEVDDEVDPDIVAEGEIDAEDIDDGIEESVEDVARALIDCGEFIAWRPMRFSVIAPTHVYDENTKVAYQSDSATFKDVPGVSSSWIVAGECSEDSIRENQPAIQRITDDDELAQAAANVRKAWRLIDPEQIPELFTDSESLVDRPLKIAMIASAFAEIINRQDFLKNEPLQYIQGQQTITTNTRPRTPPLGLPFIGLPQTRANNGYRPAAPFIPQMTQQQRPATQTPRPTVVISPFSSLWPNGSIPRLSSDRLMSGSPLYAPPPAPRRYLREVEEAERFGNRLHESLPREIKRRIWDEFLSDSLNAKGSVEEQNNLIRRLERGHSRYQEHHGRMLTATEIPISQKVDQAASVLEDLIKEGSFSVPMIEAARLYLATLKHHSQTRLMSVIADYTGKDDGDFIKFRKEYKFDHDLEVGLLLLSRLQDALNKL